MSKDPAKSYIHTSPEIPGSPPTSRVIGHNTKWITDERLAIMRSDAKVLAERRVEVQAIEVSAICEELQMLRADNKSLRRDAMLWRWLAKLLREGYLLHFARCIGMWSITDKHNQELYETADPAAAVLAAGKALGWAEEVEK